MRVTQSTTAGVMLQGVEASYSAFETTSAQIASGLAITKPSDNPAGAVQVMSYDADITRLTQYQANASDGLAWLGSTQNALASMGTQLQNVQQLVEQAANATTDANGRAAIANQIDNTKASLLADANTTYLGRPVFGGTTGAGAAYDSSGNYVGDSGAVTRTLAPGTSVQVNVVGTDAFGSGSSSIFSVLDQVSSDLRSSSAANVSAIGTTDLAAVQQSMTTLQTAQATVGSRYAEVQSLQSDAQARQTTVTTARSSVADLDLAKAETDLSTQQLTYEAALQATARVLSLSLSEFLK